MTTAKLALHEAAHLAAFCLYVGGEHLKEISHLDVGETRRGYRAPDEATRIDTPDPDLTFGKILLAAYAAEFLASGEADAYTWLENKLEEDHRFTEFGAEPLYPVFEAVCGDIRGVWPAVEFISARLEKTPHIAGSDLQALAMDAGLIPGASQGGKSSAWSRITTLFHSLKNISNDKHQRI